MAPAEGKKPVAPVVAVTSVVAGVGMSVPERVVKNDHFASYLETSDEWIRDRTGIVERRWAADGVSMSELSLPAAERAIASAGLAVGDIDGIVCATVTPDHVFPSTACCLQKRLGMSRGFAFDVNAVCSGFLYALTIADGLISRGQCENVLVVGADMFSRIINPNDRSTCVLFGDGAGAVVLSRAAKGNGDLGPADIVRGSGASLRGIYASEIYSDGSLGDLLTAPCGTANPFTEKTLATGDQYVRMNGREVFKLAVRSIVDASERLLKRTGFSPDDVDYFISHQANKRILLAVAKQMAIPQEKVPMNVDRFGNTSAASLPILLAESAEQGTLKKGDLVLLSAFGGGVTWGALLLRW